MTSRLEVTDLHTYYGSSHVLFGINLTVDPGECVCLLGRNGVGKSTTLKSIMGLARVHRGTIHYGGRSIVGLAPHAIARLDIGYAPDDRLIFPDLTVRDNLEIAAKQAARKTLIRGPSSGCMRCSRVCSRSTTMPAGILAAGSSRCSRSAGR